MFRRLLFFALLLMSSPALSAQPPAHHGKNGFQNLYGEHTHGFFGIIRARLSDAWQSYDEDRDIVPTVEAVLPQESSTQLRTTWIGHATMLIQHRGINVLTDPMFSQFASPVSFAGPRRITQPALDLEDLPPIHAVIISHDHYDHLDTATIKALGNEPKYFVPLGIKKWMIKKGIREDRIHELDWWESASLTVGGEQVRFTATPAQHFSGRSLWNRNKTLWSSWALEWSDFNLWFGGDTGYNEMQFKEIGRRLGPFDLAFIPIGAYEPRWFMQTVHVNPSEAVQIHLDIGAVQSIGMHWGTFVLAGEGVLTPPAALARARREAGLDEEAFRTLAIGEFVLF